MVTLTPSDIERAESIPQAQTGAPLVVELPPKADAADLFLRLRHLPGCLWLDSSRRGAGQGDYSFLTADPIDWIQVDEPERGVLDRLDSYLNMLPSEAIQGLPPFQGGLAGVLSYDLGRSFENCQQPDLAICPRPRWR